MKNYFEYKGYMGKPEFSAEDQVFFGTIFGINDLVTFEGDSVAELERSFRDAVDDYLELCERMGKEPEKAYRGSFNVRIEPQLHKDLAMRAAKDDMSLNQAVECAIKAYLTPLLG